MPARDQGLQRSDESDLLWGPLRFSGLLQKNSNKVAVAFEAWINDAGELETRFDDVPLTHQSAFLLDALADKERPSRYDIEASSLDGIYKITSNDLIFSRNGTSSNDTGTRIQIGAEFQHCIMSWVLTDIQERPMLKYYLRGVRGFGVLSADTVIGPISFAASSTEQNRRTVSGWIAVMAGSPPSNRASWNSEAQTFLDRLLPLIAFASGNYPRAPLVALYSGREAKLEVFKQTASAIPFLPPFHFLNLSPFFNHAIKKVASDPDIVDSLKVAISWQVMDASYNEMRLVAKMTALENLVSRNLSDTASSALPKSLFKKLTKDIRLAIDGFFLHSIGHGADEKARCTLKMKVGELNRRSLQNKIEVLVMEWRTPIADLPKSVVKDLVNARNNVVHRGLYYDDSNPNQAELWSHVTCVHEIVNRLILSALSYSGTYECCLGGLHTRKFEILE